jgi:hypothetical protein
MKALCRLYEGSIKEHLRQLVSRLYLADDGVSGLREEEPIDVVHRSLVSSSIEV